MTLFNAAALVDMQESHTESLLRENPSSSKQHLEMIINNQKEVLAHCKDTQTPVAVITYQRRGDLLKDLEYSVESLPKKIHILKKLPKQEERIDEVWKDKLVGFYDKHKASKIFLMGMFLGSCVYDTALHLTSKGYKVITAEDVVDDPKNFPKSTKPNLYDVRTTYLSSYKDAL